MVPRQDMNLISNGKQGSLDAVMSSHRPRSYTRPLRRKKSRWKGKVVLVLILAAAGWYGVPYLWNLGKKYTTPKTVTQVSQTEAMDKLKEVLLAWELTAEELKTYAQQPEQKFAWMENERARDSAKWLLAQELDSRGLWQQSQPMIIDLLKKRLQSSAKLTPEENKAVFASVVEWGDKFMARGDSSAAEQLSTMALQQKPESAMYFNLLIKTIDLRNKKGDVQGALELLARLHSNEILSLLKTPESTRQAASYLLMQDDMVSRSTGNASTEGEKLAFTILEKANLSSSPEMGRILLARIKDRMADISSLTLDQNKALQKELEDILVCFRASGEDMVYAPEVMLAVAKLQNQTDNVPHTVLWLDRAEGSAMTLGVDTPRVLKGNSLKQDIAEIRNACREKLQQQTALQSLAGNIKTIAALLEAKDWKKARETAQASLQQAKNSKFADGYIPVFAFQLATAYAGESNWSSATATYESVLTEWAQLSAEEEDIMPLRLAQMGYTDYYKILHRDLANAYLKQDMVTKATETMKAIGEELPKQEARRSGGRQSSSSRRSR